MVGFAPLAMMAWLAFWVATVSEACCVPPLSAAHHSSPAAGHEAHHHGVPADAPATPLDGGHCPHPGDAELVPASLAPPVDGAPEPVFVTRLPPSPPLPIFITAASPTFFQQAHPPPRLYLRTRRLLI